MRSSMTSTKSSQQIQTGRMTCEKVPLATTRCWLMGNFCDQYGRRRKATRARAGKSRVVSKGGEECKTTTIITNNGSLMVEFMDLMMVASRSVDDLYPTVETHSLSRPCAMLINMCP